MLSTHEFCCITLLLASALHVSSEEGGEFYFSATYPVADTPHGNSDTVGDGQASPGDGGIIILLLGQLCGGNILGNADIELGEGDLQSGSAESDQLGLNTTNLAKNQMCLGADTVDGNTTGL